MSNAEFTQHTMGARSEQQLQQWTLCRLEKKLLEDSIEPSFAREFSQAEICDL